MENLKVVSSLRQTKTVQTCSLLDRTLDPFFLIAFSPRGNNDNRTNIILPKGEPKVAEGDTRRCCQSTKESKDEGGIHQRRQAQAQSKPGQKERISNRASLEGEMAIKEHHTFNIDECTRPLN
jgi:hypothetical protein